MKPVHMLKVPVSGSLARDTRLGIERNDAQVGTPHSYALVPVSNLECPVKTVSSDRASPRLRGFLPVGGPMTPGVA
jgi:hypothetical protein